MQQNNGRTPMKYWRVAYVGIALACLAAAYYSIRLGYAEYLFRTGRLESIERAADLVPLQADYQARLDRLELAVRLNPHFSAAWIELGMRAEAAGDLGRAEMALLQAARVDRTFAPRWTLANFYFRRENWNEFWKWTRAAAEMSYGDRTALFQLCWRATSDPALILERAIPPEREILGDYVYYLANSERYDAAQVAASRWLPLATKEDVPRLLWFCDLLLEKVHSGPGAFTIWNALIDRGWLPYQPGSILTNGAFQVSPISHGFDWRVLSISGVHSVWTQSSPGLVVAMNGHQPEQTDLLIQWMPMQPSAAYELSIMAQLDGIPSNSGLRWKILDASSGAVLAESGLDAPRETIRFETGPHCSLVKLVLGYQRAQGTSVIAGRLVLSSVALRMLSR